MRGGLAGALPIAAAALALAGAARAQEAPAEQAGAAPQAADAEERSDTQESAGAPAGAAAPAAAAAAAAPAAEKEPPYTVECGPDPEEGSDVCRVDRATYVGWRTFHSICHTCHAQDAVGSTFAPALLPRIMLIDKARFLEVVDQGFTGQVGVMPGWAVNPNVNRYYDELWSYLRARADGVLLPGRPKRLPDDE